MSIYLTLHDCLPFVNRIQSGSLDCGSWQVVFLVVYKASMQKIKENEHWDCEAVDWLSCCSQGWLYQMTVWWEGRDRSSQYTERLHIRGSKIIGTEYLQAIKVRELILIGNILITSDRERYFRTNQYFWLFTVLTDVSLILLSTF